MDAPHFVDPVPVDRPLSYFHFGAVMRGLLGTCVPVGTGGQDAREWSCWATGRGHLLAFLTCACIDLHSHQECATWSLNQDF